VIPVGNQLINIGRFRLIVALLVVELSIAYLLLPMISNYVMVQLVLILFIAIPTGIFYTTPALCAMKYFPSKNAKINALLQFGQGVGCAFFSYLIHIGCNP
jgi:hypothetical protein